MEYHNHFIHVCIPIFLQGLQQVKYCASLFYFTISQMSLNAMARNGPNIVLLNFTILQSDTIKRVMMITILN